MSLVAVFVECMLFFFDAVWANVCVCVASPLIFFPLYSSCSAERKKAVYIQNRTANIWSKMNFVFLVARSTTFFLLVFQTCYFFFISHHTHSYGWLSYLKNFIHVRCAHTCTFHRPTREQAKRITLISLNSMWNIKKYEDEHDDGDNIQTNLLNAHLWIIKIWE